MNRFSAAAAFVVIALAGCNLTYDREGLAFDSDSPSTPTSKDAEPNDTTGTALPLTLGTDVTGTLATETDADYWVFTVPAGTDVRFQTFDANGTTCDGVDPKITVYYSDGFSVVGSDDDGGISWCEDVVFSFPAGGIYYVKVEGSGWNYPPADYLLRTTTAPSGGSFMTLSCNRPSYDWCDEITGTLTLSDVVTFRDDCLWSSGNVYAEEACPASTLAGYCDPGAYSPGHHWLYYPGTYYNYTQATAEADCASPSYGGTWVGGTCSTAPKTTSCDFGAGLVCVDLTSDPANCGACGNVCAGTCAGGTCNPPGECLAPQYAACGAAGSQVCVDRLNDPDNCGACGVVCGAGTLGTCSGGYCDLACGVATPNHCGSGATQYCADFLNDPANCNGCNTSCTTCAGGVCDGGAGVTLVVQPLFPSNGANWNDWVVGSGYAAAIDTACDPAGGADCIHAGDLRAVTVTGKSSCNFLSATDALGAFDWVCDGSTNPVRFLSTGLKPGKRLADLLDVYTPGYRSNSVTVLDSAGVYGSTATGAWWTNPVSSVPPTGILDVPGTLYVADGSYQGPVTVLGSRIALVIPAGIVLGAGAANDVVTADAGELTSPGPRDFLWFEGDVDVGTAQGGFKLWQVRYSIVRGVSASRAPSAAYSAGLYLQDSSRNLLTDIVSRGNAIGIRFDYEQSVANRLDRLTAEDCSNYCVFFQYAPQNVLSNLTLRRGGTGVLVFNGSNNTLDGVDATGFYNGVHVQHRVGDYLSANGNRFTDVSVAANRSTGLRVEGGTFNEFSGITATNNGGNGVEVQAGRNNSFFSVLAANNAMNGIVSTGGADDRYAAITAALNDSVGFTLNGTIGNVVGSVALHGNRLRGMQLVDAVDTTLADLAIAGSQQGLVEEGAASTGNAIHGRLLVGANSTEDCFQGTPLGAFDAVCNPMGTSTFVAEFPIGPLGASFFGRVPSDSLNPNAGLAVYVDDLDATWLDWTSFENGLRAWTPIPTADANIGCQGDSNSRSQVTCAGTWVGNAEAWDWSLSRNDAVLRAAVPVPTEVDVVTHHFSDSTSAQLLLHAVELPGYGDGDGLCEDGEACLELWNFGAYQGPGTVEFLGVVSGVSLPTGVALYRVPPLLNGI